MQILAILPNRQRYVLQGNSIQQIRANPSLSSGFTLIEIIVVLVLMGLLSSIVLPKLTVIYDNFIFRTERDELLKKITTLGFEAYNQQQAITIDNDTAAYWLEPPEDWQLIISTPIKYKANGFCQGGTITLSHAKLQASYHLSPPYCRPQIE